MINLNNHLKTLNRNLMQIYQITQKFEYKSNSASGNNNQQPISFYQIPTPKRIPFLGNMPSLKKHGINMNFYNRNRIYCLIIYFNKAASMI